MLLCMWYEESTPEFHMGNEARNQYTQDGWQIHIKVVEMEL